MWPKAYRDYKTDQPLVKNQVIPGHGIVGCEMHDLNGWGEIHHRPFNKTKRGIFATLLVSFLSRWNKPRD
jgi:hypothetical protein